MSTSLTTELKYSAREIKEEKEGKLETSKDIQFIFDGYMEHGLVINPNIVRRWNQLEKTRQELILHNITMKLLKFPRAINKESLNAFCEIINNDFAEILKRLSENKRQQAAALYRKAAEQGYASSIYNLMELIIGGKIIATAADFKCAGIEHPDGDRYQQAAALYRKAVELGSTSSIHNLAYLIEEGQITATTADFKCAGIEHPDGDRYQQAAALFRKAAEQGHASSIHNLAVLIRVGKIIATAADFKCVGIEHSYGGRYKKAAALFRKAVELGCTNSIHNLASLIEEGLIIATGDDFICAGIEYSDGDKYQQAAALYRKAAEQGYDKSKKNLLILKEQHGENPGVMYHASLVLEDQKALQQIILNHPKKFMMLFNAYDRKQLESQRRLKRKSDFFISSLSKLLEKKAKKLKSFYLEKFYCVMALAMTFDNYNPKQALWYAQKIAYPDYLDHKQKIDIAELYYHLYLSVSPEESISNPKQLLERSIKFFLSAEIESSLLGSSKVLFYYILSNYFEHSGFLEQIDDETYGVLVSKARVLNNNPPGSAIEMKDVISKSYNAP